MKDTEVRKYETLTRVGDFGATHVAAFPPTTLGGELFAVVNATVSELDGHLTRQNSGAGSARQATASRSEARDELRRDLEAISRTARSLAETITGLDDKFRLPRGKVGDQLLIGLARAFAADAVPLKGEFLRHEMPANFLDDLNADITAFEEAVNEQNVNVEKRVAATAAIEDAIENGMRAVRRLDAIVRNKFEDDAATLAAWTRASHTERSPRPASKQQPASPPPPTP
jgi:hypothetical protein